MIRLLSALVLLSLFAAESANAYGHRSCGEVPLRFRGAVGTVGIWSGSFPTGGWREAAADAFVKMNDHPGNYRLDMSVDTFHVSPGNGESEMWFSADALWNGDGSAMAHYYDICVWFFYEFYYVNEVDVIIDSRVPYTFSESKRDLWFYDTDRDGDGDLDGGRPFAPIVIHEMSHGLGFTHNDYNYNVMGEDFTHLHVNGPNARGYVGEDLAAGIVHLYGLKARYEDVAVSHWRYVGSDGEYSMHGKNEIIAFPVGTRRVVEGEEHFDVAPNQFIVARFTFENLGLTCQNMTIGYYVSTNASISMSDRRIGGATRRVCPNAPDTRGALLRLPADLSRDRPLWLGAIVNEDGAILETSRQNNATYIPMWVN
ncbi:MAG: hypothetical protein K2Q06_08740 [Parvularculaceae bacterium]|nr:hypothetical protein [Parvularculaceae bacterium]